MDKCGECPNLPLTDKRGWAWCSAYPGHWNQDYQRYTGGYCHLETPACDYFKIKQKGHTP